jgi:hypothetical protein
MKIETINEFIKVGAIFKTGEDIRPAWFVWEGRKYTVKEVNYFWLEKSGREKLFCFSVTDGANTYELNFNAERAVWKLTKICQE